MVIREQEAMLIAALTYGVRSGKWVRSNCPFCIHAKGTEDKKQSLGFYPLTAFYGCFRCGTRGVAKSLKKSKGGFLPRGVEVVLRGGKKPGGEKVEPMPPEGFTALGTEPGLSARSLEPVRRYLLGRGLTMGHVARYQMGVVIGGLYRYRDRVVLPVLGTDGVTWLGVLARDLTGRHPRKYVNSAGMMAGQLIFQHHLLNEDREDPILVCEGAFDALPYEGQGVALLGKPSLWQVNALAETARPIVVVLDGDAWEEGRSLSQRLRLRGKRATYVRIPPKEDPNSIDPGWLVEEARQALSRV